MLRGWLAIDKSVVAMRTIEITYDRRNPRPWLALDRETGELLLRLTDRDELEQLCTRLGWHIARSQGLVPNSATIPLVPARIAAKTAF
jgi:hypothetical protein